MVPLLQNMDKYERELAERYAEAFPPRPPKKTKKDYSAREQARKDEYNRTHGFA